MICDIQSNSLIPTSDNYGPISAFEKVPHLRLCRGIALHINLAPCASRYASAKELIVVNIIKDENPFPDLVILQPIYDELEYIDVVNMAPRNIDSIRKITETLLTASYVTCMDPENPRF